MPSQRQTELNRGNPHALGDGSPVREAGACWALLARSVTHQLGSLPASRRLRGCQSWVGGQRVLWPPVFPVRGGKGTGSVTAARVTGDW